MHRAFEELGVTIHGVVYGQFTGEAQFDATGSVVQIDVECQNFGGSALSTLISGRVRALARSRLGVILASVGAIGLTKGILRNMPPMWEGAPVYITQLIPSARRNPAAIPANRGNRWLVFSRG